MAWTPPTKITVIISFLVLAGGLFVLSEILLGYTNVLPALALGAFNSAEVWGMIAMVLVFLAWFLMFLGVKMKGL